MRGLGNSGIPKQPLASMLYEPAGRREFDAASDVLARRPYGLIVCQRAAAIQAKEFFGDASLNGGAEAAPAFGRSPLDAIATVTGTGDAVAFTTSSARSSSYHAPTPVKITTIVEMRKKRDRAIRGSYKLRVYRSRGECNRTAATNKAQSVGDPGTVPSQKREMGTDHCTIAMV